MDAIYHDYLQLITVIGTSLPLERPPLKKGAKEGYLSCFVPPYLTITAVQEDMIPALCLKIPLAKN
jgi:hypothetical protein